ncbi:MAG TPA: ABC transporter permease, partial [Puia sp.]|nr:ABC transporter permease [Puia sp.]
MLKYFFKVAWRNLVSNEVSTCINILGLTLGITACLIIYLIVSFELSFENFHRERERIYRVVSTTDNFTGGKYFFSQVSHGTLTTIRAEFNGIENSANLYGYYAKVTIPGKAENRKFDAPQWPFTDIVASEPQYFQIFNYQWLAGDANNALNQPFKVVLVESRARKYFGQMPLDDIIGKEVVYNDSLHLTVSGIVKDLGSNSDLVFKDFISFSTIQSSFLKNVNEFVNAKPGNWGWADNSQVFVKLAKGVTPAQFEVQMAPMINEHIKLDRGRKAWIGLQPLSDMHFNQDYPDFYSRKAHLPTLYGLMAIAAFILVIACINFINLSTAQSMKRAKEIGIRKVLGSSRASLVWQFLRESFILTLIAMILSVFIAAPILNAFQAIIPPGVAFHPIDPFTLAFLLMVTCITSLLAGFYPGKVLSSFLPVVTLKGRGTQNIDRKNYLRKSLIVFQFTVSILFIIGAIVIGNQIHYLLNKDLGFKKYAIININTSGSYPAGNRNVLAERVGQIPGVVSVTVSKEPPIHNHPRGAVLVCDDRGTKVENGVERVGDEHYVSVFGLQIVAGRNFVVPTGNDSHTEFLISQMCARQFGFKNPEEAIGHTIRSGYYDHSNRFRAYHAGPVVGILADFNTEPLRSPM